MKLLRLVQWLICLGIPVVYFRCVLAVYQYRVNTATETAANTRVGNLDGCNFGEVLDCSLGTQPVAIDWFWQVWLQTWAIAIPAGVFALYLVFVFAAPEKVVPWTTRLLSGKANSE